MYGITKDQKPLEKLKPKQCPNCRESNKMDSRFCSKCRMVLSYNAYTEAVEHDSFKSDTIANLSDMVMDLATDVTSQLNKIFL